MGKQAVQYDLHILGDGIQPEERHYYDDPAKAVIAFNRLACERRRRAVLSKTGHLPGLEAEIVGSYVPEDDAPPIRVRAREEQPAFPREQERVDQTGARYIASSSTGGIRHAARWYAYGMIDALGPLSPFDRERDAAAFASYHAALTNETRQSVMDSWVSYSEQRREVTGK